MPSEKIDPDIPILVAENDPSGASALKRIFEECQLRNITFSEHGYKAVHTGRFDSFGLILVSSKVDKMDGLKVISSLLEEGKNKSKPIVFLCPADDAPASQKARAAGAAAVLSKPVELGSFREMIEKVLDKYVVTKSEVGQHSQKNISATESAIETANKLLKSGDLDGAEEKFEEAMVTGGGSVDIYHGLARVHLSRGDQEKADQVLVEAERLDSMARDKFRLLEKGFLDNGRSFMEKGLHEEAKNQFQGALASNANSVTAHMGLTEAYKALGDEKAADGAFESAMALEQRPEDLHEYNRMGIEARRKKNYYQAIRSFDKAISFDPDDPVLYYNKSMVFVAQMKFQEASELLEKSLQLNPNFSEAKETLTKIRDFAEKQKS
ncbi:MAG: response regulator [bacterium]|nr:response regulator [bacterium]